MSNNRTLRPASGLKRNPCIGAARRRSLAFSMVFRKKKFHSPICCNWEWKMASDKLEVGGFAV